MRTFVSDGLTFDVTDRGPRDGAPVVCLHGFPQDASAFDQVADRLVRAGRRVLAPDQRGYSPGARPAGRRAYALDRVVADVVALLDAAGLARAHVVGHDWGGAVAWALAVAHPERVERLTVLATAHPRAMLHAAARGSQGVRSAYVGALQLPLLPEAALLARDAVLLRGLLRRSGLPAPYVGRYVRRMQQPGALSAALAWYRALALTGLGGTGPVTVPTVYARGAREPAITRTAARGTARHVHAPYRHVELAGAGHWLPERRAADVAALVLDPVG